MDEEGCSLLESTWLCSDTMEESDAMCLEDEMHELAWSNSDDRSRTIVS